MRWSPQQDRALLAVNHWLQDRNSQVFRLFGYAGTGKTTLAQHLASGVSGRVLFAAFTGKAAHVLQSKGCHGASTIHSLIYHSHDKTEVALSKLQAEQEGVEKALLERPEDQDLLNRQKQVLQAIKTEKANLKRPGFTLNLMSEVYGASLVVIDECSMVDKKIGEDLLSFGAKILVLGDPAQLPPIGGAGFFTENVKPDIMLDEIHRQAADSPIIRMATDVRNKKSLKPGNYGECKVILGEKIDPDYVLGFDQILVGRNRTRFASNARVRSLKGINSRMPVIGDRLVCLRNNHNLSILNGALFTVVEVGERMDEKIILKVRSEDTGYAQEILMHEHHFRGKGDEIPIWARRDAEEFDYGYALTVHKSQGSQWDSVILFDESQAFQANRHRWLYTGITRAAKKLSVIQFDD